MTHRTFSLALILAAAAASAWGNPSPQMIGYQGRLRDAADSPLNGSYSMTFAIYTVPSGGSSLWSETQTGVPVNNGVFSVQLGSVNPLTTGLFGNASAYLEVQVAADPPMTPRQRLVMSPYAFRALLADDLAPGDTDYIQNAGALQSGAVFHVSSGTVEGPFLATQTSSFTAVGPSTYSLATSSGIRVLAGTLRVEGSGGVVAVNGVSAATVTAVSGLFLPQGSASDLEGSARWDPTQNLLFIGTGTSHKTMVDTDSSQTLTNKTLNSTDGNLVDANYLQTRPLSNAAPSDGMTIEWNAGAGQWYPVYSATITVLTHPFTPNTNLTMTASVIYLIPISFPGVMKLNQIRYRVSTAVGGVFGDAGLYDASGNLVASGGASSADYTTTAAHVVTVLGAPVIVQPGQYYAAITANGAPALRANNLGGVASTGVIKGLGTASEVGGTTLPASVNLSLVTDGVNAFFMGFNE